MVDIESNTVINFTDNGWLSSGSFRTGEGIQTYTSTSSVNAGSVITFTTSSNFSSSGSFALSASGDQLIAYQGDFGSPTIIFAVNFEGAATWQADATSSNTSSLPSGLTNGTNAVAVSEWDNIKYNGSTSFSSSANALASIVNNSNWDGDDENRYDLTTFGDFSLPVELTSFTATLRGSKVILHWITESEIENLGFLLERRAESAEHGAWETVADYKTNGALTGQGSVTHRTEYKYTDEKVRVGQTYSHLLVDVDYHGKETRHDPVSVTVRARGITMKSAYPNPFNPMTKFMVIVGDPQHLSINVYDITGRLVKTLTNEQVPAGEHIIAWDGTNNSNQTAGSGIYFVRLIANGTTNIQKVVLTRWSIWQILLLTYLAAGQ